MFRCLTSGIPLFVRRQELGLSLEEVADAVGVSPYAVRSWEDGYSFPSLREAFVLAHVLRVQGDLFGLFGARIFPDHDV